MGIRDWLAIIVIVFIVLILLDGFRRKWIERKNRIVVKLDKNIPAVEDGDPSDPLTKSELPNGGARTITRSQSAFDDETGDVPVLMESVDLDDDDIEEYSTDDVEGDEHDGWDRLDADENDGQVDESDSTAHEYMENDLDDEYAELAEKESPVEEAFDETAYEIEELDEELDEAIDETIDETIKESAKPEGKKGFLGGRNSESDRIEPTFGDQELTFSRDDQGELDLEHHNLLEAENDDDLDIDDEQDHDQAHEVIIINVMARSESQIEGKALLQILLKQGMRLGEMSIFHRHADSDGKGPVMFSMANMLKPGTFSMSDMENFTTPGVSFFMQIPNNLGNMHCFDQMLKTAEALKNELDVLLKDENRSVFTRQTIEHSRQRIRDFELEMLAKK